MTDALLTVLQSLTGEVLSERHRIDQQQQRHDAETDALKAAYAEGVARWERLVAEKDARITAGMAENASLIAEVEKHRNLSGSLQAER